MVSFFTNLLRRDTPASSMRYVFVFTFLFVNIVIWSAWLGISLAKSQLQEFPAGTIAIVNLTFLTVTGGAWLNKREETKQLDKPQKEIIENEK